MKKHIIQTALILIFGICMQKNTQAQFSASASLGVLDISGSGELPHFGFNLSGRYHFNKHMSTGINYGYYMKSYEDDFFGERFSTFINPITASVELAIGEHKFQPVVGVDMGIYRIGMSFGSATLSEKYFGVAPCAGFNLQLTKRVSIIGNAKYNLLLSDAVSEGLYSAHLGTSVTF